MIASIPKWVHLSVCKHFTTLVTGLNVYLPENKRKVDDSYSWCELRVDGPSVMKAGRNELSLSAEISVLIATIKNILSVSEETINIGKVLAGFTDHIDLFRYGDESDDTAEFLDCMRCSGEIKILKHGQVDSSLNLLQSVVRANYKSTIILE